MLLCQKDNNKRLKVSGTKKKLLGEHVETIQTS